MRVYIFLYNVFIHLYLTGIRLASLWNQKARLWVSGRAGMKEQMPGNDVGHKRVIWMHCASLGEFEQGRPLLEALKRAQADSYYLVTFFSPSGYEVQKNYAMADRVMYLPAPTAEQAAAFISTWKPSLVLWVKYEYWYHYLVELKRRQVPLLLVSAIFRDRQPFFKWYGQLHRRMLQCFIHLFVQDSVSMELLHSIDRSLPVTVSGDTRFDRVIQIAHTGAPVSEIEEFAAGEPLLVAGSTWKEDEEELHHYCNTRAGLKLVIAPHHIDEPRLEEVEAAFSGSIRFSVFKTLPADQRSGFRVLIIDNVGMLSRLYRYATITYVGGGFGNDGVHNVLEAAVYGKPVLHGPVFDKYREALELVEAGGAIAVDTALELEQECDRLLDSPEEYKKASDASLSYVRANSGATAIITEYIDKNVPAQENRRFTS